MELDKYQPKDEWYAHRHWGLHGKSHAARVLVWVNQIGRQMQNVGTPLDLEAVRWAAVLHDVRRLNDNADREHGERAAVWTADNAELFPLDPTQLECTCYCCRWHVPYDQLAPEMTPELTCLKDADSLDRVRLGDLNPKFLRTAFAKDLIQSAQALYDLSRYKRLRGEWDSVRSAAIELNLWA